MMEIEMPKLDTGVDDDDFELKRSREENVLYFDLACDGEGKSTAVCGIAKAGQLFCVMGPPGSGKTSLLKTINENGDDLIGRISLNGLSHRDTIPHIQYVPDLDLLLPTLIVEEAIMSAVRLNMNSIGIGTQHKFMIYSIISEFGIDGILKRVVNTLSPAEKRKLNIAIAVMMDPKVLILDEPVSKYDLSESLHILQTLKRLADNRKMIVILSMSPAPSILYSLCSTFMFMYKGQTVFHGPLSEIKDFLEPLDKTRNINYSHVDQFNGILSDIASKPNSILFDRLMDAAKRSRNEIKRRIDLLSRWFTDIDDDVGRDIVRVRPTTYCVNNPRENLICDEDGHSMSYYDSIDKEKLYPSSKRRKPGKNSKRKVECWSCQLLNLSIRNFHCTRRRVLALGGILQNVYILFVCILIWWRPDRNENTIKDRMGLFFFMTVQWAFFALLDAVLTFSDELAVIIPEIKNNTYGVLTYCISKTVSDIPLTVLQPVVFLTVIYWVANLHGFHSYVGSVGVLIINIVATQSLGLLIGSVFTLPWNVTAMALTLLSMMLLGGAFNTPPTWIRWAKYLSLFNYGVDAFAVLEFQNAEPIVCSAGSIYPPCIFMQNSSFLNNQELPSESVLTMLDITSGVEVYTGVLCAVTVILRVIWFFIVHWKATRD